MKKPTPPAPSMTLSEVLVYLRQRFEALFKANAEATAALATDPTEHGANLRLKMLCSLFAEAIYNKALAARKKYKFDPFGWATPDWKADLQQQSVEHIFKGDPRDNGVLAMLAWLHGWSSSPEPLPEASTQEARLAYKIPARDIHHQLHFLADTVVDTNSQQQRRAIEQIIRNDQARQRREFLALAKKLVDTLPEGAAPSYQAFYGDLVDLLGDEEASR